MNIDPYNVLVFFHVLLFGYWLGSDWGVFCCDSQMIRHDLDIEERMRVRRIRYKIDIAPRTCLVLIMAIGFTMTPLRYGTPISPVWLAAIWIASLAWLTLIIAGRVLTHTPRGEQLGRIDRKIWWIVGGAMMAVGAYALATGDIALTKWLALKMMLYGLICWNGLWIMHSADHWYPLIEMVRRGGDERIRAEPLMNKARFWCGTSAAVLWFLVLVVGFLGTVKPFP